MQDMATMQQHSITSPAPASTIQNQDSPMDSIPNANCSAQIHQEASRTGSENKKDTTAKLKDEALNGATNEDAYEEKCSNKVQSNKDNESDVYEPMKVNESQEKPKDCNNRSESDDAVHSDDADGENMEECCGNNGGNHTSDDSDMKYVCPICETVLSSQHDFTLHIRSHNNISPVTCVKTFTCKICSKVLSSSSSLDRHVLVHSGERPFKCRICGVAFTTNGNMHRHMRTHNSPASKSESYESDGSTDSGGSFNSKKSPLSSPPPSNSVAKKRRVGSNFHSETNNNKPSGSVSPLPGQSPNENGNKRKLPEFCSFDADGSDFGGRRKKASPSSSQNSPDYSSDQSLHCPVCDREDFASLNVLETHLEENHPDYQPKCHVCDLTFKNHRVLNLHRSMAQHDRIDKVNKGVKSGSQQHNNAVLGFKDLTFVDFSSKKFPHIAVAVCEKSLHKPSSTLKFQCNKCNRAFPCVEALEIHQQADICSDGDSPTDLTNNRRRISLAGRSSDTAESEEEIEHSKREDFFGSLELQNKSVPSSPSVTSEHYRSRRDEFYENPLYYHPVNGERSEIVTRHVEGGKEKDLADIQSIISVTSASGLIQDLSKSPPQMRHMSPDGSLRGSMLDSGGGEEEQQDCFAAEFRRMKLKGEFPCRLCTSVFPNLRALKGHNRSHLTASVGIFRCNMCPYTNPDKSTLVRHMRTHNGDRPYECALCNYAFTTKANCERHLRNRHSKVAREDVKKSIIYHPSEDPINDPDIQAKIQGREEVKRTLVFSTQRSSSLEDLHTNENSSFQNSQDDHKRNYTAEDKPNSVQQYDESRQTHSPPRSILERRILELKQIRPWEKTQEAATMTTNVRVEDAEDYGHDSGVEREPEPRENISSLEALVNLTKNNSNPFPKLHATPNQRIPTKEIVDIPRIQQPSYNSPESGADSPLDLSMDALDLSKKKNSSYSKDYRANSPTKEADDSVPQDLSTKSSQSNDNRSPVTTFPSKSEQNLKANNALPQQLLTSTRGTTMSPHQHSQSPTAPPLALHPAGFYPTPQLNPLYLNSNNFPFHQAQAPFPIHPYLLPPTHAALLPSSNMDEFRSRLQKELINNLQLSGGTIFDSVMASAAERLQAFHQQAYQDYSRGKPEPKIGYNDVKIEENRPPVNKNIEKSHSGSGITKPPPVVKVTVPPKSNRERDNSSVKMVIKNGVLMPKQKQRRYRTERPFACEHCSARFTLRSNMERHIKQQHPQYWTQRQRSNVGNTGPGRRSHTVPTSLTVNLNLTNHQEDSAISSHSERENLHAQSKSPHIPTIINIPEPPNDYQISNIIRDTFHTRGDSNSIRLTPKIKDDLSTDSAVMDNVHKTKDSSSIINNNNNYNKTFISEEVKLAIAQQLKSKLNNPANPEEYSRKDVQKEEVSKKSQEEDNDDEDELIIDEEKEVEEETGEEKHPKDETKEKFSENAGNSSNTKDVDLASVSRLLDNATTQTQAFQRYFRGTQDGEEGQEGSEEDEEGLVAGSNSEGNNSGSDENKSESEQSNTNNNNNNSVEKKKSAYSLAPNRVSCPYCLRKFPWSSSLRRHVLTHTGQKPYKCPHCPLLFTTKSNCDRHLLRKHGGQTSASTAQTSGSGGSSSSSETSPGTNGTNYTMRNVPERPFKCNYCPSSTFSTQSNLKKHVQAKHTPVSPGSAAHPLIPRTVMSGDEGTACNSRPESHYGGDESHGSGSEDAGDEREHVHSEQDHSGPHNLKHQEKMERTSYLSAALESRTPLTSSSIAEASLLAAKGYPAQVPPLPESHSSAVSSADLPFKCHLCEGSYAERQEALDHIRDCHPSEFELLMSKGALDTSTGTGAEDNNNVGSHASAHCEDGNAGGDESLEQLRGKFPDYANRKVMCAFCMRRFWSAEDLRRHMRTHTGERPFSCDICRRRFTLKHSMLRHRKKHNTNNALFNASATSSEDISVVSGDEDHPSSGTTLHSILQNRTKKQQLAPPEDNTGVSGDEDVPLSVISSDIIGKPIKMALKMTNHNNNNITAITSAKGVNHWDNGSDEFTATAAAKILSSKFSTDRRDEADEDNTGTDLIGNLLGIQGSIIDKVLQSKSAADDAAKLLGVQNGNQE